jgi:hypothetical protein
MEEYREAYAYTIQLARRFHIAHPAADALADINRTLRRTALVLTRDPYFFGLPPCGQTVYRPPPAPPVSGRVTADEANNSRGLARTLSRIAPRRVPPRLQNHGS